MTNSLKLALIAAGQLRRYPVVRLRNLADRLGPVKAQSFRQASRFANSLKAGYPVHKYEDLADCQTIVVCATHRRLHALLSELEGTDFDWSRKTILLGCGQHDSGNLRGLAAKGASVGALFQFGSLQESRFFVEGDKAAVRAAKLLVEGSGGQLLEIRMGRSGVCAAGVTLATTLVISAMHSSVRCFRHAGLSSSDAAAAVGSLAQMSLRSYLRAGQRAFKLPRSAEERHAFQQRAESLERADPKLGAFFSDLGKLVLESEGWDSSWLDDPPLRVFHARASAEPAA